MRFLHHLDDGGLRRLCWGRLCSENCGREQNWESCYVDRKLWLPELDWFPWMTGGFGCVDQGESLGGHSKLYIHGSMSQIYWVHCGLFCQSFLGPKYRHKNQSGRFKKIYSPDCEWGINQNTEQRSLWVVSRAGWAVAGSSWWSGEQLRKPDEGGAEAQERNYRLRKHANTRAYKHSQTGQ